MGWGWSEDGESMLIRNVDNDLPTTRRHSHPQSKSVSSDLEQYAAWAQRNLSLETLFLAVRMAWDPPLPV
jgi:hypothetical protein